MSQPDKPGIDFFDALYEVWRVKWLAMAIIIIAVGASVLPIFIKTGSQAGDSAQVFGTPKRFMFQTSVDKVFDPLKRSESELITNLRAQFASIVGHSLVEEMHLPSGVTRPDQTFLIKDYLITLELKNGSLEKAQKIRDDFEVAARRQMEVTLAQAKRDVVRLDEILKTIYVRDSDTLAAEYYRLDRFLNLPAVKEGSFRFFAFGPLYEVPTIRSIDTGGRSMTKQLLIGFMAGIFIITLMIMFRIAIRRNAKRT